MNRRLQEQAPEFFGENRQTLFAVGVILLIIGIYWASFSRMIGMWSISDYQHGWLVYPVSLYLIWRQRKRLTRIDWRTSVAGVLLAGLLVLGWVVARTVGIQVIEFAAATMLIFASYWAAVGTAGMRVAAFPLLLLLTAVPAGGFLITPLMQITATIASALLKLAGMPFLRDGQFFTLPGGVFEVADVCSGLRYLLAGTVAALAYGFVTYSTTVKRALFLAVCAFVLVVTNGVRAFIVMFVASTTEMRVLGGQDHVVFGMVLFAIVFMALIWIGGRYTDELADSAQSLEEDTPRRRSSVSATGAIIALLIVSCGPWLDSVIADRAGPPIVEKSFPEFEGCVALQGWPPDSSPQFLGADLVKQSLFDCDKHQIGVYLASYRDQQQGKELISWSNQVWPSGWRRYADETTRSVQTADGKVNIREVLIRPPFGWRLMWYWYQVGSSVTTNKATVKLLEAWSALTFQPVVSSVLVVAVIGDDGDAGQQLRERIEDHAVRVMGWNLDSVTTELR